MIKELIFTKGWTAKTRGQNPNWLGRTAKRIGAMETKHPISTRIAGLAPFIASAINTVAIHLDIADVSPHLQRFNGMDTITSAVAGLTALGIGIVFVGEKIPLSPNIIDVNSQAHIDLDSISFDLAVDHLGSFAKKVQATQFGSALCAAVSDRNYEEALKLLTDNDHGAFGCTEDAYDLALKIAMKIRVEEN